MESSQISVFLRRSGKLQLSRRAYPRTMSVAEVLHSGFWDRLFSKFYALRSGVAIGGVGLCAAQCVGIKVLLFLNDRMSVFKETSPRLYLVGQSVRPRRR